MTPSRQFFFIHVMKTAGTTFENHLRGQFAVESIYPSAKLDGRFPADVEPKISIPFLLALPPERHRSIEVYAGHFPYMVCELLNRDLITCTILRDPVDRTISVLKQFKRLEERYRSLSLEAIYDDPYVFRHFVHNHQTKVFSLTAEDHPRGVARPLSIDAARFALAKANLARVDVVGLTERYDDFIVELKRRFGWWRGGGPPREHRRLVSSEPWEATPTLRRRIADDNVYDLEFYEHATVLARG
jgi:hypothetical protein